MKLLGMSGSIRKPQKKELDVISAFLKCTGHRVKVSLQFLNYASRKSTSGKYV